ncbi:hypothetical protein [Roseibium sp. RKSG952]|uniref:hypothetical protein n=1 Tax=Roseibium sp. RKSG952 TaxID=2529384 RepID=UPI0012BCB07D|nr:hypothetical protein [Roseibium sp. RKSG952]MTH98801.1 hypothetical protein [Roseibium sp. RKSG952]
MNDYQDCGSEIAESLPEIDEPFSNHLNRDLRDSLHGTLVNTFTRPDFQKRLLGCRVFSGPSEIASGEAAFTLLCTRVLKSLTDGPELDIARAIVAFSDDPHCQLAALQTVTRSLGEAWCSDSTNFASLTAAVSRLHLALNVNSCALQAQSVGTDCPSIRFVLPKGETHRFATALVEEHFRIRGWHTHVQYSCNRHELKKVLAFDRPSVICLSWSDSRLKPSVNDLLEFLSEHRPENTLFIAGGPASVAKMGWLFKRGVDNVFSDTYLARECAEMHVALITKQIGGQKI